MDCHRPGCLGKSRSGGPHRVTDRVGTRNPSSLPPGEQFDFGFIDADKTGYADYYEEILVRLRPGGLILLDNMLQRGRVVDEDVRDVNVAAIRSINDAIVDDPRVRVVLVPLGDGVSFVQKL